MIAATVVAAVSPAVAQLRFKSPRLALEQGMAAVVYTVSYEWNLMSPVLFVFFGESTVLSTNVAIDHLIRST